MNNLQMWQKSQLIVTCVIPFTLIIKLDVGVSNKKMECCAKNELDEMYQLEYFNITKNLSQGNVRGGVTSMTFSSV